MPPSSVIPVPSGLKFLRVYPPEAKDVADLDQWCSDLQPVLALVIDPDKPGCPAPPEVVTPTGATFSNAERYDFIAALVLEDGRVVDASGEMNDNSVNDFIDSCRRSAVWRAERAARIAAATKVAARAARTTVPAMAPTALDYEKDVMVPMQALAKAKGLDVVRPIFAEFKVKNATGLKPEQWPAVIVAVAEIAADESIPLLKAAATM